MKVNLGYVAIALNLADGSPNKTVTYSNLKKFRKMIGLKNFTILPNTI